MTFDTNLKPSEYDLSTYQFLEAEKWYCQVMDYNLGHSRLLTSVTQADTDKKLSLVCLDTRYFEGPLFWHGADFQVAPMEECEALLRKINRNMSEATLKMELQVQKLFIVNDLQTSMRIRIMAGVAFVTDQKIGWFMS
jgi:hypothetical protein